MWKGSGLCEVAVDYCAGLLGLTKTSNIGGEVLTPVSNPVHPHLGLRLKIIQSETFVMLLLLYSAAVKSKHTSERMMFPSNEQR